MSDMIERVAMVIDATLGGLVDDDDGRLSGEIRERMTKAAIAAIEAMREPTYDMLEAGNHVDDEFPLGAAKPAWQAMINAALGKVDA